MLKNNSIFQPYTAYVANLSYDIDENDVVKFFSKLKIKGVRLPREGDAETGRLKGLQLSFFKITYLYFWFISERWYQFKD